MLVGRWVEYRVLRGLEVDELALSQRGWARGECLDGSGDVRESAILGSKAAAFVPKLPIEELFKLLTVMMCRADEEEESRSGRLMGQEESGCAARGDKCYAGVKSLVIHDAWELW